MVTCIRNKIALSFALPLQWQVTRMTKEVNLSAVVEDQSTFSILTNGKNMCICMYIRP